MLCIEHKNKMKDCAPLTYANEYLHAIIHFVQRGTALNEVQGLFSFVLLSVWGIRQRSLNDQMTFRLYFLANEKGR